MKTEISCSAVHRNLDSKFKILGMEAQDLIFIMLFASVMNLIFGTSPLGFILVFVVPIFFGVLLCIAKRGKPDGYLVHSIRFYITPGILSAGQKSNYARERSFKVYEA